jgi:hypothetical protein
VFEGIVVTVVVVVRVVVKVLVVVVDCKITIAG